MDRPTWDLSLAVGLRSEVGMGDPVGEVLCIHPCTVMEELCVYVCVRACMSECIWCVCVCVCDKGSSIISEGQLRKNLQQ